VIVIPTLSADGDALNRRSNRLGASSFF